MNRAYSVLEIRSVDDSGGKRKFTGVATTPATDSYQDIVEPKGAEFALPLPFLWQHDARDPVGWVTAARASAKEIEVDCEIANIPDEGELRQRLDTAWHYVKNKLIRGLSIGFNPIESARIDGTYGYRYTKWKWLELSLVTIPANHEATITAIKSADTKLRALSGQERRGVRTIARSAPVSGKASVRPDRFFGIPE